MRMKKLLLFIAAVLMTVPMMAIGLGDGSSKDDAKEFNWEEVSIQDADTIWYRVPLDPIYEEESPTLALYLTNLSNETAHVTVRGYLMGEDKAEVYDIPAKTNKIWSKSVSILVRMQQREAYLCLTSNAKVALSAKVYETTDLDEACMKAKTFNWATGAIQPAGDGWWKVDLTEAKQRPDKTVAISIQNLGNATAYITGAVSPDCPSSGKTEKSTTLAAGATRCDTLSRAMIDMLGGGEIYIYGVTTQRLKVTANLVDKPNPTEPAIACNVEELKLNQDYHVTAGTYEYRIPVDSLKGRKLMPEVTVTNDNPSAAAKIDAKVSFACENEEGSQDFLERSVTIGAGKSIVREVEKNMVDGIKEGVEYVYIRFTTTQAISFSGRLKHIHEGDACKTSVLFDWEKGNTQQGGSTVWYAVSIKEAKEGVKNIHVYVENLSSSTASVYGALAFSCPYTDLQDISRRLGGHKQVDKVISYSLFGQTATDTVYVGVTTDQSLKMWAVLEDAKRKDPTLDCNQVTDFDWTYGNRQKADTAVWYRVKVDTLRHMELLPYITVRNENPNASALVKGELSYICPDTLENSRHSITIGDGGLYEKLLTRDMAPLFRTDVEYIYVRVESNQPISIQIRMQQENEGSNCRVAIPFNWVSGNDQAPEDGSVWYRVDLTEAKAARGMNLLVQLTNKDRRNNGEVDGSLATTCPCESPQDQSVNVGAGITRTKEITRSMLETFGDTVWIRVNTTTDIHFEAHLVPAEQFDTIDACLNAIPFEWGTDMIQSTDTAWYYVLTDTLNHTTLAPQAILKDLSGQSNNIKVEVAYECPVTEAMTQKSTALNANATISKVFERSLIDPIVQKYDTVWFRVTRTVGKGDFLFRADLVDPNTGDKCAHAQLIAPKDTAFLQEAGTTAWYKIARREFAESHLRALFSLTNTDNTAGRVTASVYTSCDSTAFEAATRSHGAGSRQEKEVGSDFFRGFSSEYIYLELTTKQQVELAVKITEEEQYEEVITACDSAIFAVPNQDYYQTAGTQVWYKVDLLNIRENTIGDGLLTIKNLSGNTNDLIGEISWVCPVIYKMTTKGLSLTPNQVYTRVVERSTINASSDSVVYIRVTAPEDITFRFDITLAKGDLCSNPIIFDWEKGNVHPGGQHLWYKVELDSTKIPANKDIKLYVTNLTSDSAVADADLTFDCLDQKLTTLYYEFAPDSTKSRIIDRDLIGFYGWPTGLFIRYSSNKNTHIWVELVDALPEEVLHDTVPRKYVCDETRFHDIYTGRDTLISSAISPDFIWEDHVPFRKGTLLCDSVHHMHVTPIVAPDTTLDEDRLRTMEALPLVIRGMKVFTDSATAVLNRYFRSVDTDSIMDIVAINWEALDNDGNYSPVEDVYRDYLAKDHSTPITLHYILSADCNGEVTDLEGRDLIIMPDAWKDVTKNVNYLDTICAGTQIVIGDNAFTLTQDSVINDTIQFEVVDSLEQVRRMDTIYAYSVKLWKQPDLSEIEFTVPSIAAGQPIDFTTAIADIQAMLAQERSEDATIALVDSIGWEMKNVAGSYDAYVDQPVASDATEVTMRFFVRTICGDILYGADSTWTVESACPDAEIMPTTQATICPRSRYTWIIGERTVGVYTAQDIYHDTIPAVNGCDSIIYTLDLHVLAKNPDDNKRLPDTTVYDGYTFDWLDGESYIIRKDTTFSYSYQFAGFDCDSALTVRNVKWRAIERVTADLVDTTICTGTVFEGRISDHKITADTAWTDSVRAQIRLENDTIGYVDSIYSYNVHIYRNPDLSEIIFTVPAITAGEAINFATASSEIQGQLDAQTLNNSHVAAVDSIGWEMKNGEGNYEAYIDAPVRLYAADVTMRYFVRTICGDIIPGADSTWTVEHICLTPDSIITNTTICAGTSYKWEIDGRVIGTYDVDSTYRDTVAGAFCDSVVNVLHLHIFTMKPDDQHIISDTTIYDGYSFNWMDGESYIIRKDTVFTYIIPSVEFGCDSASFTRNVKWRAIPRLTVDSTATVCAGTVIEARLGNHEITADVAWKDSIRAEIRLENDTIGYVDSIYTYKFFTYKLPDKLPANLIDKVKAVCGSPLDTADAEADIRAYLVKDADGLHMDSTSAITWKMEKGGRFGAASQIIDGSLGYNVAFRVTVTDRCNNSVSLQRTIEIEDPVGDQMDDILVGKYEPWLLMIHVNKIREMLNNPDLVINDQDVSWFTTDGTVDTELPGVHGLYYTSDKPLAGKFFAKIYMMNAIGCYSEVRTNTIDWSQSEHAPLRLVPNMVKNGESMTLENLDADAESAIHVYDGSGNLIFNTTSTGLVDLEIKSQGAPGIYMMRVESGDKKETLRYIIK